MGVKIDIPQKAQDTNMGRRLFALGAPIVGGAFGGPVGAAAGTLLGQKAVGASTSDAVLSAAKAGVEAKESASEATAPNAAAPTTEAEIEAPLKEFRKPELGESVFGRRLSALSQDPRVGIQNGLNELSKLPVDHQMRKMYTAPLVKAQYLSGVA